MERTDESTNTADAEHIAHLELSCASGEQLNGSYVTEPGRTLIVAATNDTVDALRRDAAPILGEYALDQGLPVPLIIRKHSPYTEREAVRAMIHPESANGRLETFTSSNDPIYTTLSEVSRILVQDFKNANQGSGLFGDKRFKYVLFSEAQYILQLAGHDSFPLSPEIAARFSTKELAKCRICLGLSMIQKYLKENGTDGEYRKMVDTLVKKGTEELVKKANVIICTVSVANDQAFARDYSPHFMMVEEASRLSEVQTCGLFSLYPLAKRLFLGDNKQLGPFVLSKHDQHNYASQAAIPIFKRLEATGFPVQELQETRRFGNPETHSLCKLVYEKPDIVLPSDAVDEEKYQAAIAMNCRLYGVSGAVIFVDVDGAPSAMGSNRSRYNTELTKLMAYHATMQAQQDDQTIAMLSPYVAQVTLMDKAVREIEENAKQANDTVLQQRAARIQRTTIDSFEGKEADVVLVDCMFPGHILVPERWVVASTRGKHCVVFFGQFFALLDAAKRSHPIRLLLHDLNKRRLVAKINAREFNHMVASRRIAEQAVEQLYEGTSLGELEWSDDALSFFWGRPNRSSRSQN